VVYCSVWSEPNIEHDEGTDLRFPFSICKTICRTEYWIRESSVWDKKEWGHLDEFCQHHWTVLGWNENNWYGGLPKVGILERDTRHSPECLQRIPSF
jgi:hypothetical protein